MTYSDEVLQRVREPRRVGAWPEGTPGVGTGEAGSLDAGTLVRIQVKVQDARVVEARFKVFGCSAAIASASLAAEWLEGASIGDAQAVTAERLVARLRLAPERAAVARMTVEAARLALRGTEPSQADGRRPQAEG